MSRVKKIDYKSININNLLELKKIIVKGMVTDEKYFKYGDGFKVFEQMDKHIVGVS
mgnify:CR=1 FL=1